MSDEEPSSEPILSYARPTDGPTDTRAIDFWVFHFIGLPVGIPLGMLLLSRRLPGADVPELEMLVAWMAIEIVLGVIVFIRPPRSVTAARIQGVLSGILSFVPAFLITWMMWLVD